ncbi:MAG: helix-turn-helix domain-containing protein [Bifidobacteriaceae bacterium]|jgi:plasmid maintenance system antidote protein VapI|nr:helix-turn-helix domain-containing protein [Bifidobacteriaceae bacterium]
MDTRELNRDAAAAIADVLKSQSKSIVWLSHEMGIPYATAKRIVSGDAWLTMDTLAEAARALGVPVERLMPVRGRHEAPENQE